jgi:radical SAM-linked protein
MIGLPTEQDEDVVGIVDTGQRMLQVGRTHVGKRSEVTVSVSSHIPKPHTPFQWCGQDSIDEIARKQRLLRTTVTQRGLRLKYHDRGISFVEGVMSRGDRRLAPVIEAAWEKGARFDSWDELFDVDRWASVFEEHGVDVDAYMGTRPITARLPWDHIDVGLEDGFLLSEYRKSVKNRLSPPCGKVKGALIHHTNLTDANADTRKLVCYDCGVACDLTNMREERKGYLRMLGAEEPPDKVAPVRRRSNDRTGSKKPTPQPSFPDKPTRKFRLRYTKLGRAAYLGHLDTTRVLARLFRRAHIEIAYTRGFHPKPNMQFSPALSLGVPSLGEMVDIAVESSLGAEELHERLRQVSPEGIEMTGVWELAEGQRSLAKLIKAYDLLVQPAPDGIAFDTRRLERIAKRFLDSESALVPRKEKEIDVRGFVSQVTVMDDSRLAPVLGWSEGPLLIARVAIRPNGSAKPSEVAKALGVWGGDDPRAPHARIARMGFLGLAGEEQSADALASAAILATISETAVSAADAS